jgi:hemerythrin
MSLTLQWSDAYCVDGNIDSEHRRLFELANKVFALIDPKRQMADLKDTINALYTYMEYHFGNEQRLMLKIGYLDYERHAAMHKAMTAELNRLMTASHDLEELTSGLHHLMVDWLLAHILREDRKIAVYTKRSAAPPTERQEPPCVPEASQTA